MSLRLTEGWDGGENVECPHPRFTGEHMNWLR